MQKFIHIKTHKRYELVDITEEVKKIVSESKLNEGIWKHDKQDGNSDSHLKTGLPCPNECIPIVNGKLGLSTRQNIFCVNLTGSETKGKL